MKKFFRKVGRFIKRNIYALAVTACVVLVLAMITITAVTIADQNQPNAPDVDNEQIVPSVPSGSDNVITFCLPMEGAEVYKIYAEDTIIEDLTSGAFQTHQGVDFKAGENSKVLAVYDGEITGVENSMMDGLVVTITHSNNLVSVYKCLSTEQMVNVGDKVTKGQEIGIVATSLNEKADGVHLHYELYENNKLVDPMGYFESSK